MGSLVALWLCAAANAAEGLAWTWDASQRYLLELDSVFPRPLMLRAEENREVRIPMLSMRVDTTCMVVGVRKSAADVRCTFNDVSMAVLPLKADVGRVVVVLDEAEKMLAGASMELSMGFDGKMKAIDLEGLATQNINDRVRGTQEVLRLILVRAFAALDLTLPKDGVANLGDSWTENDSKIVEFPSMAGTVGSVPVDVAVARVNGPVLTLTTKGRGIAGPGELVAISGVEKVSNNYDLTVSGWANFDTAKHVLTGRQYEVSGPPTAGSSDSEGGVGNPYIQNVKLTLTPADEVLHLEPNQEMPQPE